MSEATKVEQSDVQPEVQSDVKSDVEMNPAAESTGSAQPTKDISELSKEDADALSAKVAKQGT